MGFHVVDDDTRMEERTVHSYDIRLKEKRNSRSMKDVILIDLQENNLHTLDDYVNAINTVANVPTVQQYTRKEHVIPIVADWPGQIHAVEEENNIPCNDDDECTRPTKYAANSFEKALLDFQVK
ncbi:hypothetical protein C2G38_2032339 [Gigaspora rosea]|uniref:Uncharacterized protein n=1 Tax=Gigaspora rosea TaxID=44941 RepID=A0A397VY16_9GLOM|nr:hypothetical protein C2G38_2032339 [Gigaspora rosea]